MKTIVRIFGVIPLVVLIISCSLFERDFALDNVDDRVELPDSDLGSLKIDFGDGFPKAKTLKPPMDIVSYIIDGTLDRGDDSFTATVQAGESLIQNGLTSGLWTITVGAINENSIRIGEGTNTAQIYARSVTTVQITITPLDGNGTLDLTIQWNKHLFTSDDIIATVTPQIGGSSSLSFDPIDEHGVFRFGNCLESGVPEGYYVISMQLIGNGQLVWAITDAVRILAGETTDHTYTYPPN